MNAQTELLFGLNEWEVETMLRLVATTAEEAEKYQVSPYHEALMSFGDSEEVHQIALRLARTFYGDVPSETA